MLSPLRSLLPSPLGRGWRRSRRVRGTLDGELRGQDAPHPPSGHLLPQGEGKRWIATAALVFALGIAALLALDRVFPPNLSKLDDLSIVVTDRSRQPLRVFPTRDGQYRMRAVAADVDARYLDLLVAYEDRRFAAHPGVDPFAVLRAAGQWIGAGHPVSGASTLTMQVARLLEPRPRTLSSKLVEAMRAVQLEWRYGKDEILGFYLTLAPFGGNLQGVHAATRAYFGKGPAELTLGETALLIALPQAPTARRPDTAPDRARDGQAHVLARLAEQGKVSRTAVAEALEERAITARLPFPFAAPHLSERIARVPASEAWRRTSIDGALQASVETLAGEEAGRFADGATMAILVMRNGSRMVEAYLGGHDFFGPQGQVDVVRARRSPGSTLKPFVYALGFDDLSIHPETRIADLPLRFAGWAPRNFDRDFKGEVTVREALQQSLNLPAVAILDRVGPERFHATLAQSGVRLALPHIGQKAGLPVVLGGAGISLYDLVGLYGALADQGRMAPLRLTADAAPQARTQLFSPAAAWYLTGILADTARPDSFVGVAAPGSARRIAYKTGTSYGFRDAWAVGYSASHTVGVWVGRTDGTPRPGHYGRNTAAPILFKVFDLIGDNVGLPEATAPTAAITPAPNQALPVALKRFQTARHAAQLTGAARDPRILFPPEGTEVELARPGGGFDPLTLEASGGTPPYRWLVNGTPLDADDDRFAEVQWQPDGAGFARISVVDAAGRSASVEARIK